MFRMLEWNVSRIITAEKLERRGRDLGSEVTDEKAQVSQALRVFSETFVMALHVNRRKTLAGIYAT